jgi:GTP pyrophosphokinase
VTHFRSGSPEQLFEKAARYLPAEKLALIKKAYEFARQAHQGQLRLSGGPYLDHPLQVALTLVDLQLDGSALAASLLHDTIEDCGISLEKINKSLGLK